LTFTETKFPNFGMDWAAQSYCEAWFWRGISQFFGRRDYFMDSNSSLRISSLYFRIQGNESLCFCNRWWVSPIQTYFARMICTSGIMIHPWLQTGLAIKSG
jgi:hypothetical protein